MRNISFKSIPLVVGMVSAVFSWDTAFAANLCEGSTSHSISSASSTYNTGSRHVASRAIDNKYANWSRWSSKGRGESIVLDLGRTQTVDQVQTAWYKGNERSSYFDVETSTNGSNWQSVLTGAEASGSNGMLTFDVQSSNARYVKIIGQGSSTNQWNSLIEAKVFECPADTTTSCDQFDNLNIASAFTSDSIDANYTPSLAIDNSLSTNSRWSSKGIGQAMTVDLGRQSTVRRISTAWYKGDSRQAFFNVQTSANNSNWTTVLSGAVAQGSLGMIDFNVTDTEARYVKIIGNGNSSSTWNSVVELDVYGCGEVSDNTPPTTPTTPTTPTNDDSIALIQSLFDLEGGDNDLNPLNNNNEFVFDALAARHVTPNGNGWRHEYKMATGNRRAMSDTSEDFAARITPVLSDGSKTIVAQYHGGDTGTLVKIYVSDTNEGNHDDSRANNGIFDVYGRLRTDDSESETIINFGTIRSGQSFDLVLNNRRGLVFVSAMGVEESLRVSDSDGAYLKFGNYLQAQEADTGDDIDDSDDWADFYRNAGITDSEVTFSNINYERF